MASSFTTLGIEKMATGENAGTWGDKTNTNLDIINVAVSGYVEQAVTSGGTLALSITDGAATATAQNAVIKLTGTITGNSIVTVPDSVEKVYIVTNGTSGAYTVQFKTASGTGVTFGVSEKTTKLLYSDGTNIVDAGFSGGLDVEGRELILDADGDTSLTADTDDQIDIKIAGADDFQFTANTFTAQSGSTIAAQALTATTVTASGIVKTDDTTEATSTTDGSLQTDGGLSVAKDAVIGDDLKLLSDSAVLSFGADSDITVTHAADTGLTTNGTFQATTITATTAFVPDASDGAALGTSALEFSDLFLADGAVVNFGDDQEIKLTHVADTGLTLKHTATADDKPVSLTLQTGETDIAANDVIGKIDFQAPDEGTGTDAILVAAGIEAVSEGDFSSSSNATKLSFKTGASEAASEKMSLSSGGNLTISGDLTVSGDDITMGTNTAGNLLIADGTNFNSIAAGSLSEISTVANDDVFIAVDTSGGGLKKIARSAIVSGLATSAAISNVADDSTPQLGGDLDMNGQDIVTTSNADIELAPNGTGHVTVKGNTNSGAIQFNCESNSHGQIVIAQPHSAAVTNTLTLPAGSSSTLVSLVSTDTLTNKTLTTPKIAHIDSLSSGDITLDADGDINLDADGGDVRFKDANTQYIKISKQNSDVIIQQTIDSGDTLFVQSDGTTTLTLDDDTTVKVSTDLTVGDDLGLISDAAVLTFGADSEITLTHDADVGLKLKHTATADDKPIVLTLQTGETDMAANDVMGAIRFQAPDEGTGTDAILVAAAIQAVSEGDFSSSSNATKLEFHTGASEAASSKMTLSSGGDLTLITDSSVLGFGADTDTTLTHTDGTGLTLNSTNKLCFNDASQFIQGASATVLDIAATDEIELTATLIDVVGNLTSSGIITANAKLDLNGTELILDADADTSITADTDDQIDIRLAGADDFTITANTFTILSGSTIAIAAGGGITNAGTMSSDITSTGKALVFGF